MSPKKKRSLIEFTYILPFLLLVAVFSYFPLYGWIYAFHDFVPPKPISNDTFVGLKWFTILFSNPVRSADVLRVMRNTLAMSGISLFFSWFPMIFAVFLNEIKSKPYRKFVQTATTLPNFISWVLVFSIAFNVFGSNGAVNAVLKDLVHRVPEIFGSCMVPDVAVADLEERRVGSHHVPGRDRRHRRTDD